MPNGTTADHRSMIARLLHHALLIGRQGQVLTAHLSITLATFSPTRSIALSLRNMLSLSKGRTPTSQARRLPQSLVGTTLTRKTFCKLFVCQKPKLLSSKQILAGQSSFEALPNLRLSRSLPNTRNTERSSHMMKAM